MDPAYGVLRQSMHRQLAIYARAAGFFLNFSGKDDYHVPQCDTTFDPPRCSNFYHDQLQVTKFFQTARGA